MKLLSYVIDDEEMNIFWFYIFNK